MRAIKIDPAHRAISEIDLDVDPLEHDKSFFQATLKEVFGDNEPGLLEVASLGGGIEGWFDEEGLFKPWDEQSFFAMHPPGMSDTQNPFAGAMVIVSRGRSGDSAPLHSRITVELMERCVTWMDAKNVRTPAPKIYTQNPDGSATLVHDGGTWTYDNQP